MEKFNNNIKFYFILIKIILVISSSSVDSQIINNVTTTTTSKPITTTENKINIAVPTSTTTTTTTTGSTDGDVVEYVGIIRKCKKGTDSELNECFKHILNDLKPKLAGGVPEIQLPPLDPLDLDRLDFVQGTGSIVIKSVFTNIKIKGLSNFTKAEFTLNSKEKKLNLAMSVPRVRIDGKYTLGGRLIFIPIGGTGPYWFDVGNVEIIGFCKLKTEKRTNGTIAIVDKVDLDLTIKDIKINLMNLFNGNQILGPVINNVLNEEGQALFQEIKPQLSSKIGEIVASIANAVISNLSFLAEYLE